MPHEKHLGSRIAKQQKLEQQLAELPTLDRPSLQKLWQQLFDRLPSSGLRRETLIPILAYRLQEQTYGGLKESTARKLCDIADDHFSSCKPTVQSIIRPKAGTRYIREWQGKLHEVSVLETGYEYEDSTYRSLTEIAKAITGTKWSGPAFFGHKRSARKAEA